MDSNNSVEVRDLAKSFSIKYTTIYGGIAKSGTKQVLNGLSFDVKKGEVLGIIGRNGSGKSTLLKILTNIMSPDSGSIQLSGKVASILELGMGFDNESSGRDNIRIKCSLYGMSNSDIDSVIEDIILFSELGDQIDHPLRTYSSGMTAKLAFSILAFLKSDLLIIDEVLSVGDASFNSKCRLAFHNMKKTGCSIIIASHNISTLETMCDRVLWIEDGKTKEVGDPISTCYHYNSQALYSIETVLKLADSGDVVSMNRAGEMFRDGITVPIDLVKSESYFKKASDMGSIDAQLNLADLKYKQGHKDLATELYQKAALSGNPLAITILMQLNSDSEIKEKLIATLYKLSNEGNTRAMKLLADTLYQGYIVDKNIPEAIRWYQKTVDFYYALPEYQLGLCYRDGIGVNKDPLKSVEFLSRSSEHGNMKARVELANMYRKGIGVERNMLDAIKWYERAAKSGDTWSMLQLGLIYRDGLGIEKDSDKADTWLSAYSQQALSSTEYALAEILRQSFSDENRLQSINWYEDAAKRGNINSLYTLGNIYRDGIMIAPDSSKAAEYYSTAADKMNPYSIYELAMLYLKGNGVPRDLVKSKSLFLRAAKMGNRASMIQYTALCEQDDPSKAIFLEILNEYENLVARIALGSVITKP